MTASTGNSDYIRNKMENLVRTKQKQICSALEKLDPGKTFLVDEWARPNHGGGGISCVLQEGKVFEKAGVNVSIVRGRLPPAGVEKMRVNHKSLSSNAADGSLSFYACGLSLIVHPVNPMAPTVHLNYRYFETHNEDNTPQAWWFGGGSDLTPSYLFEDDARLFHQELKNACDQYDPEYYPKFKKWCDQYFVNRHRSECRGIGGIFFDDLDNKDPDQIVDFQEACFDAFLRSYIPIVQRRKDMVYSEAQKDWQQLRRGRYVEFNLIHDRGTAFGLQTPGARIESILCSMPLTAKWLYDHHPEPGTPEARLEEVLQNPVEWLV